ncbi:MAG: M48 family metallopeptidase [Fusobacteriaceae bacterium]
MKKKYQYGNRMINYSILKKEIKNITLKVTPLEEIIIIAPIKTTDVNLEKIIKKRAAWIDYNLSFYEEINSNKSKKTYKNGFSHRYLGRNYRLKVFKESDKNLVKYNKGYIEIYTKENYSEEKIQELLEKWYFIRAKEKFQEVYDKVYSKFKGYKIEKPKMKTRKMKTKWGSYSPNTKTIFLNLELIKVSLACLEYVIIHEIIHVIHLNHSKKFYGTLATILPDWEERKKILEKEGINL